MSKENAAIAILNTQVEAENAVKELQKAGFDMKPPLRPINSCWWFMASKMSWPRTS